MKTFAKLLMAACLAFSCVNAEAFSVKRDELEAKGIFGVEFPDGTSFFAKSDMICLMAMERYFLGNMIVSEVSIQLLGQPAMIKIYNVSPKEGLEALYESAREKVPGHKNLKAAPDELVKRLEKLTKHQQTQKVSENLENAIKVDFVAKEYPITTHSKTNEYIVPDLAELLLFYRRISLDFAKYKSEDEVPEKMEGSVYVIEKLKSQK